MTLTELILSTVGSHPEGMAPAELFADLPLMHDIPNISLTIVGTERLAGGREQVVVNNRDN